MGIGEVRYQVVGNGVAQIVEVRTSPSLENGRTAITFRAAGGRGFGCGRCIASRDGAAFSPEKCRPGQESEMLYRDWAANWSGGRQGNEHHRLQIAEISPGGKRLVTKRLVQRHGRFVVEGQLRA